ncbi:hypothetical protein FHL15_011341 [Xylaria flabelliformis]|uniref:Uncharacterized protein n=1 Tax=Xylaria flabelliformis TaxID=2512241 RepID=A0A553HIJ1_9PEZI|nr:hypothetical protein FHL15_011341 [Xylaria flabelliformis]
MVPPKHRWLPKYMADIAAADELPVSMCFHEAFAARIYERIDDEEYYRHVFAHLTGTSHKNDETEKDIRSLESSDPFAYSVLDSAKKMAKVEDLEAIISRVRSMQEDHVPHLLRMLAMRALIDKRPDVLNFCLNEGGFEYEPNFVKKADIVTKDKDPELFRILTESDFGKKHTVGQHPAFQLDIGGRYPVDW